MPEVPPRAVSLVRFASEQLSRVSGSGGVVRGDQGVGGGALGTNLVPKELGVLVHGELGSVLPWNQASFLMNRGWEGSASVCCIAIDFRRLLRDRELPLPPHNMPFCSFIGILLHWPQRLIPSRWRWFCLPSPISCPLPLVHRSQGPGWWVGGRPEWWVCVCKRAPPLEQTSGGQEGHLGALKSLLATSMGPGLLG